MADSLEDITNDKVEIVVEDVTKPDIEQGKDRSSGILSVATALFFIGDACYMYFSGKYTGTPRSVFQELGLTKDITYTPHIVYTILFGGLSISYWK